MFCKRRSAIKCIIIRKIVIKERVRGTLQKQRNKEGREQLVQEVRRQGKGSLIRGSLASGQRLCSGKVQGCHPPATAPRELPDAPSLLSQHVGSMGSHKRGRSFSLCSRHPLPLGPPRHPSPQQAAHTTIPQAAGGTKVPRGGKHPGLESPMTGRPSPSFPTLFSCVRPREPPPTVMTGELST